VCDVETVIRGGISSVPPVPPRHQHTTSSDVLTSITDPHVNQLINEGFDEDSAKRALHLAKDNVQLARDILSEFCQRVTPGAL